MRMPGFTAEKSLRQTAADGRQSKRGALLPEGASADEVQPAGPLFYAACVGACKVLSNLSLYQCAGACIPALGPEAP
ncbi:MAG TPA: hypothetical protein VNZ44_01100 [Pyrinomonadaceae bacterium]|nr:hypothetical protein [Pyrinomonadaceae bacterium]